LVRELLPGYPTLWVNTIGMRMPGLSWGDLRKIGVKLRAWMGKGAKPQAAASLGVGKNPGLRVISPRMYPGFRTDWQRRLNARWIAHAVNANLAAVNVNRAAMDAHRMAGPQSKIENPKSKIVVLTTLPITADLIGRLDVDRWVYYGVDDFSVWPGVDGSVMQEMERAQVAKVDALVAVSETLRERYRSMGREATLLTHGIDLGHWSGGKGTLSRKRREVLTWREGMDRPIILFWGLVDGRLDVSWCRAVVEAGLGTLVLVGPVQAPPPELARLAADSGGRLRLVGSVDYEDLPEVAAWADVLVMPYADMPVTRAMQPLKFKEYLAAGWPGGLKPVVARALPAVSEWADAADTVGTATEFVAALRRRLAEGLPMQQREARRRLAEETWAGKARELEKIITG